MSATLSDFKRLFPVTAGSLLVGWRGIGPFRKLVTIPDIRQFALEKLETGTKSIPCLAELATVSEKSQNQVEGCLADLAAIENSDCDTESRKWIVSILEKRLQELPTDPLYGLLELTEFWSDLGFPNYSPHQLQGKDNEVSPKDYYTEENYKKAVNQHKEWIKSEIRKAGGWPRLNS